MAGDTDWLSRGEGKRPRAAWMFATEAPLVALAFARETGETLAADEAGGLYRLDRKGKLANVTHGPSPVRGIGWSDTGGGGIALVGEQKLYWFDRQLNFEGWIEQTEPVLSVALEAHGMYAAANLSSCATVIYDSNRKQVRRFRAVQPLKTVEFLLTKPALVAVTEFGMLVALSFAGESLWQQQLFAHVGDLAITGDGRQILLASYTHGIKCHDEDGSQVGSYQMGGTVSRVSASFDGQRIAAATEEHFFYYMNSDGQILWRTIFPEDVCRLFCDPLGNAVIIGLTSGRIVRLEWK